MISQLYVINKTAAARSFVSEVHFYIKHLRLLGSSTVQFNNQVSLKRRCLYTKLYSVLQARTQTGAEGPQLPIIRN